MIGVGMMVSGPRFAIEPGLAGPLDGPSAYYMKSPPRQMRDQVDMVGRWQAFGNLLR